MATTRGRVYRMAWNADFVCVYVGASTNNVTILLLQFLAGDALLALESKRLLVKALATALHTGLRVAAGHGDNDSVITDVSFEPLEFSLAGPAIHRDFFSLIGSGIPDAAEIVFDAGAVQVAVTPDFRRPHWLLVSDLPSVVPTGRCDVFLRAGAWHSSSIPVTVSSGPPMRRRVLYSGRPVSGAYTIVFAASPGRVSGTTVVSDGILSDRPGFHAIVANSLRTLLTRDESLLRTDNLDRMLRFATIFDTTRGADANTALVGELAPNILEPQRDRAGPFASAYWERADVIYCISGSTTHDRASAWFTTDEAANTGAAYTYDGTNRTHGLRAQVPGTIAMATSMDATGLTPIHEFGHAASDFDNGMVIDLYVDDTRTGFVVNKKLRAMAANPVPANFATALGTTYTADASRDGIGYPATWTSYHPALQVTNRPNLMDNYWLAGTNVLTCRLDGLSFDWMIRRIRVKSNRPE